MSLFVNLRQYCLTFDYDWAYLQNGLNDCEVPQGYMNDAMTESSCCRVMLNCLTSLCNANLIFFSFCPPCPR